MRLFFASLLFVVLPAVSSAQALLGQARIDSLLQEAARVPADSDGVRLLDALSNDYQSIDPTQALYWAGRELALARRIGWPKGESFAHSNMGLHHRDAGRYTAAIAEFDTARVILESLHETRKVAELSLNLGSVYLYLKQYEPALRYTRASLAVAKSAGDLEWTETALCNIGLIYAGQRRYDESISYLQIALTSTEQRGDSAAAMMYTANLGSLYAEKHQFAEAIALELKALHVAERLGLRESVALYTGNIGANMCYLSHLGGRYKPDSLLPASRPLLLAKGIDYLCTALKLCQELGYKRGILHFGTVLQEARAVQRSPSGGGSGSRKGTR